MSKLLSCKIVFWSEEQQTFSTGPRTAQWRTLAQTQRSFLINFLHPFSAPSIVCHKWKSEMFKQLFQFFPFQLTCRPGAIVFVLNKKSSKRVNSLKDTPVQQRAVILRFSDHLLLFAKNKKDFSLGPWSRTGKWNLACQLLSLRKAHVFPRDIILPPASLHYDLHFPSPSLNLVLFFRIMIREAAAGRG